MRDPQETGAHANRVASFASEIYERWAQRREMAPSQIAIDRDVFRMAAMLHDAGKVAISDTLLKKPGRLTPNEYEQMKTHTLAGSRIFTDRNSEFDRAAFDIALNHHERWDGLGYPGHIDVLTGKPLDGRVDAEGKPLGKKEEEIPLFGRIVAIADIYDALTAKRIYKEAWDEAKALQVIEEGSGRQFDPELTDIFFSCLDAIRQIQGRYPELKRVWEE